MKLGSNPEGSLIISRRAISTIAVLAIFTVSWPLPAFADREPLELFFSDPDFEMVRLSPNGEHIALVANTGGQQIVLTRPLAGGEFVAIARFRKTKMRINRLQWANDDRLLVSGHHRYMQAVGVRARATSLFGVDRDGRNLRNLGEKWDLTKYTQIQDNIIHRLPNAKNHVLIEVWNPRKQAPSVYRLNINKGMIKEIVTPMAKIFDWLADGDGTVRLGFGIDPPNMMVVARADAKSRFETIIDRHVLDHEKIQVLGFTQDPNRVLVAARRVSDADPKGDRMAVYEYLLDERRLGDLVVGHPLVDVAGPIEYRAGTDDPIAIGYWVDRRELFFLDDEAERLQRGIDKALPGRHNVIVGEANESRTILVESSASDHPPETIVIFRDTGQAHRLVTHHKELGKLKLSASKPIVYEARDGLAIHGYLTLPATGPRENLPVVVMPHGGPHVRDVLGFDPHVQFLANRGYAVLQMNFRGSSGYGAAFLRAGIKG